MVTWSRISQLIILNPSKLNPFESPIYWYLCWTEGKVLLGTNCVCVGVFSRPLEKKNGTEECFAMLL